ncbi:MAG TPA: Calx-beta domain-containing protein [Pyrinomonadaceae bacterium]|jgi:Tol biopolymer transport system component
MPFPRRFSPPGRAHVRARSSKTFLFAVAATLACGLLLYSSTGPAAASSAAAQPSQTGLVDVTPTGAASANGAWSASVTPDGRYVLFTTASDDLAPNDNNGFFIGYDVFVRDRRAGRTILVSANAAGTGTGNAPSAQPAISANGRYVAFLSSATDLVAPDPGGSGSKNVYLRDLSTNQTVLVSSTPAGKRGNSSSGVLLDDRPNLSVSDDGRYVCFVSQASDLVAGDTNNRQDIFVRDVQTGTTRLVSVNQSGTGVGNAETSYGVMTPDGRYVAFRSLAGDLVPNDANNREDIFLRDVREGTTRLVSARPDGASGNADADPRFYGDLAVSPDGRFVLFTSGASDLVAGDNNGAGSDNGVDVFLRDTVAGTTRLVSVNQSGTTGGGASGSPAMTPDGRFVVFLSAAEDLVPNDTNKVQDVFVRDLQANTTSLVTVNTSGAAAGLQNLLCEGNPAPTYFFFPWLRPTISADGRYVAFPSAAADLTATPDANCFSSPFTTQDGYDIFVRDTQAGSTRLVSTNMSGESAGAHRSIRPQITPDGRHVLFASAAGDLVPNDTNGETLDLFVNVNLPAAGQVRFAQHVFQAGESAGQAVVTVTRTPGAAGAATVSYATLGGTAAGGSDFTPTSGTLDFAPGEESKQFVVPVSDDSADEEDENVLVRLTDETGGSVGEPALASVVIADDDASPRLSVSDASVGEGDGLTAQLTFVVTLSEPSQRTITARVVTQNGTATGGPFSPPGSDFEHLDGTYTFPPGSTRGLLQVNVWPDTTAEPDETFTVVFSNPTAVEIEDGVGVGTIVDDDGATFTKVQFAASTYTASEAAGRLDVQVTRTGDLSGPSSVSFWTIDFQASSRTDYGPLTGFLSFAPGESSKTIPVFVTDDALREDDESFLLLLFAPRGSTSGAVSATTINIKSDDAADGPSPARQGGSTSFFVRQHYRDFLGRDPDESGLQFWTNEIESCGTNQQCREVKRINVSAAFFLSIEFQQTGYLVYKTYKAAYGNMVGRPVPVPLFWFVHDAQQIGHDVVVNQGEWRGQLEQNKRDYFDYFIRDEFFNLVYPASLTPAEFVGGLDANAGGVLTAEERASLASELAAGTKTRAGVLRAVAENAELSRREFNKAFVLMQYFGYLRRDPDVEGFNFWLGKLNDFKGDYIQAEMVKAFISSDEYLKRFGQ